MIYEIKYNEAAYNNRLKRIIVIFLIIVFLKLWSYSNDFNLISKYFKDGTSIYFIAILDLLIWGILLYSLWQYLKNKYKNSTYNFTGEYVHYTNCKLEFIDNAIIIYSKNINNKILLKDISQIKLKNNLIILKIEKQMLVIDSIDKEALYNKLTKSSLT